LFSEIYLHILQAAFHDYNCMS